MDFEAKVISDLGTQTGVSKAGNNWKKKEYVLETPGMYPRKVKVTVFGDRSDTIILLPGNSYRFSVDLESREFNGRWYTDVNVYAAQPLDGAVSPTPTSAATDAFANGGFNSSAVMPGAGPAASSGSPFGASDPTDDLPF